MKKKFEKEKNFLISSTALSCFMTDNGSLVRYINMHPSMRLAIKAVGFFCTVNGSLGKCDVVIL
jgi:hypothetical protein